MTSVVFLIHHEDERIDQLRIAADSVCAMYDYLLTPIDCTADKELTSVSKANAYDSLDEALNDPRFAGWGRVFFDAKAPDGLETFTHPADKVLYIFGHDSTGFNGHDLSGETVLHLKSCHGPDYEHFALSCLCTVAAHRFYQVDLR